MGSRTSKLNINIEGDKFIKIPYEYNNKKYHIMIPLHEDEHIRKKIISFVYKKDVVDDIYINNILECKLKIKGKKEMDITKDLESYMGPDQIFRKYKDIIKIEDILPTMYKEVFEYIKIMDDNMDYKIYTNLNDCIFEK